MERLEHTMVHALKTLKAFDSDSSYMFSCSRNAFNEKL